MTGDPPKPVGRAERIESLDVMRGIALLGIFIMNMPGFSSSFFVPEAVLAEKMDEMGPLDSAFFFLTFALLEGKFNGLFTLLFGMGLALQLERLSQPGAHAIVARRLTVLLVFGLLHTTLLWGGDVLHIYAVLGLLLWTVRRWPAGRLLGLATALLLAQFAHGVIGAQLWSAESAQAEQIFMAEMRLLDDAVFGSGSWLEGVLLRSREALAFYTHEFLWPPTSWFWLALATTAVLGLWARRVGWIGDGSVLLQRLSTSAGSKALALLFIAALLLFLASAGLTADQDSTRAPTAAVMLGWMLGDTHRVLMVLCYAGLILRWCAGSGAPALRRRLAQAGRMPLTLYLMQSLMGTFIFHGWGLGYWDQAGPAALVGLAVLLYAGIQLPLAGWWLARFEMGPAEALWRRLSYGRPPSKP